MLTRITKWAILPAFFLSVAACCIAQDSVQKGTCTKYKLDAYCPTLANEFSNKNLANEFSNKNLVNGGSVAPLDNPMSDLNAFASEVASKAYLHVLTSTLVSDAEGIAKQAALQTISTKAAVNQIGAPASSGGGTSLVTKPSVTDFVSLAAQSGAFTDTLNGNTLTASANANGLLKFIASKPVFERWDRTYADVLQHLTFGATLNVAQTASKTAITSGTANTSTPSLASVLLPSNNISFSSFTVSFALYKPYNPQDKSFIKTWQNAVSQHATTLNTASSAIARAVNKIANSASFQAAVLSSQELSSARATWHAEGMAAENAGDFDTFVKSYSSYVAAFIEDTQVGQAANQVALNNALNSYQQAALDTLDAARGKPLVTINYVYATPNSEPSQHQFTAAVAYVWGADKNNKTTGWTGSQLTGNFTTAIYSSLPAGAKYGSLRDLQTSLEFDKPFGGQPSAPRLIASLSGYGQYQYDPTVLNITAGNLAPGTNIALPSNAQVLLGTSGWIGVVQGKITVNISNGLSIPAAISWANKTELLAASDVRGQVGLSYDLSALSSLLKGK